MGIKQILVSYKNIGLCLYFKLSRLPAKTLTKGAEKDIDFASQKSNFCYTFSGFQWSQPYPRAFGEKQALPGG